MDEEKEIQNEETNYSTAKRKLTQDHDQQTRTKRMFTTLLGSITKERNSLAEQTQKRSIIEKRLLEKLQKEKEELESKRLEKVKEMARFRDEAKAAYKKAMDEHLSCFLKTETKPCIYYSYPERQRRPQ